MIVMGGRYMYHLSIEEKEREREKRLENEWLME